VEEEEALQEGGVLQLPWARGSSRAVEGQVVVAKEEEEASQPPAARFGVHATGFRLQPPSWHHRGDGREGDRLASGVEEGCRLTWRRQVRLCPLYDGRLLSVVVST
jgi:hypothetical protein